MQARYRYRLEPDEVQRGMLARTFGCARVVFNDAIRCREDAYRLGVNLSPAEVQRQVITEAKARDERAWLSEVASVALVQSVRDAHRAFSNFFASVRGKRRGRKIGRPRFKSRKDNRQSFRLTRNGFSLRPNGRLYLAKVGEVRVRWSRALPSEPSSVTILREPDGGYYASFVVEVERTPLPPVDREAGVDLGITRLATIAGTTARRLEVPNPKHLSRKLRKLARLEREKARRVKGSANRAKTRHRVADLNIAGMVGNHRLARAILDVGWAQFVRLLEEKAERHGRSGAVHDRDYNAALNILAAGQAERLNAGGAPVSPSSREVQGDEAGSNPNAA
ncbi:RNA-guided endonuclease InsQ/TnpB family protein [Amycolatopsis tolypomycina]|uniref:RNA-guided endonuclease InsQ/TnpB family protein n=1 Tax=Amycolatopsis tolypomycina TaxID=208445 RepID=UPI0033A319D3